MHPELVLLRQHLERHNPLHVAVDLSRVEIMSSPSVGSLLMLREMQEERKVRLFLCGINLVTRCILRVVGLDTVFDCIGNKYDALRILDEGPEPSSGTHLRSYRAERQKVSL